MTVETLERPITPLRKKVVMQLPRDSIPVVTLFAIGGLLAGASGPTSASTFDANRLSSRGSSVVALARAEDCFSLAEAMAELKLRTGLTWDQLSNFFSVSRKTVHNWAKGLEIKPAHRERVENLLTRVRALVELRPFEVRREILGEEATATPLPTSREPPILFADQKPIPSTLEVHKRTTLKIKRPSGGNG